MKKLLIILATIIWASACTCRCCGTADEEQREYGRSSLETKVA